MSPEACGKGSAFRYGNYPTVGHQRRCCVVPSHVPDELLCRQSGCFLALQAFRIAFRLSVIFLITPDPNQKSQSPVPQGTLDQEESQLWRWALWFMVLLSVALAALLW